MVTKAEDRMYSTYFPAALLLIALLLYATYFLANRVYENNIEYKRAHFNEVAHKISDAISYRVNLYDKALLGGVGFFQGSSYVDRSEWRSYVRSINLHNQYPGLNGVGYIESLQRSQVESFIKKQRAEGEQASIFIRYIIKSSSTSLNS